MSKKFMTVSDGEFSLSETENENQFYFYRNDRKVLGDVGDMPMDLFQALIIQKMMTGEITELVVANIRYEYSEDETIIRLTTSKIGEKDESVEPVAISSKKQPNFIRRLFNKVFG